MESKVFCTQEGMHDYTDAEQYGRLTFLTASELNNVRDGPHNEQIMREIRGHLREFEPEHDYLLVAGSPYIACAAFLYLGNRGHTSVRVLRWSNQNRKYIPLYINLRID